MSCNKISLSNPIAQQVPKVNRNQSVAGAVAIIGLTMIATGLIPFFGETSQIPQIASYVLIGGGGAFTVYSIYRIRWIRSSKVIPASNTDTSNIKTPVVVPTETTRIETNKINATSVNETSVEEISIIPKSNKPFYSIVKAYNNEHDLLAIIEDFPLREERFVLNYVKNNLINLLLKMSSVEAWTIPTFMELEEFCRKECLKDRSANKEKIMTQAVRSAIVEMVSRMAPKDHEPIIVTEDNLLDIALIDFRKLDKNARDTYAHFLSRYPFILEIVPIENYEKLIEDISNLTVRFVQDMQAGKHSGFLKTQYMHGGLMNRYEERVKLMPQSRQKELQAALSAFNNLIETHIREIVIREKADQRKNSQTNNR